MDELKQQAIELLAILWRGMPADYKSRYRMNIWDQFRDQIRSAAYTSSLDRCISSLCQKLNCDIGRNADDRERAEEILNSADDRAILKLLRDETTVLVLHVRVANQARRKEWEEEHLDEWTKETAV